MKHVGRITVIAAVAAISAVAVAQTPGPAKTAAEAKVAIDARKALFEDIKKTFEPMGAMLRRQREMDTALVATNSVKLQELAGKIPAAFAVDTRQFKDVKTDALDGIWASQADFKAKADAMSKAAENAANVAKGGDRAGTTRALAEIGKSCGACHDSFKVAT